MGKEIIYSFKEYQEKYNSILEKYFLEYVEIEEIDFIDNEIKNYQICLKLVNFPIDKIFNIFWRVEYGINLKAMNTPQEAYDFIFANENSDYYYKIYNDIVEQFGTQTLNKDVEKKIKQVRLMFPKIISFLETKKSELETTIRNGEPAEENEQYKMYFKVGLLFAEKKIYSKIVNVDNYKTTKYYYKNEVFDNPSQLSKRLNLTRQFINDSFNGANTKHNIFKNIKQLKIIVDYCNKNTITIDSEFLIKYSTLIENRY